MTVSPLTLDRFDRRILDVLQVEGRISNQELAERIGLSPSPCLRRVRALEELMGALARSELSPPVANHEI